MKIKVHCDDGYETYLQIPEETVFSEVVEEINNLRKTLAYDLSDSVTSTASLSSSFTTNTAKNISVAYQTHRINKRGNTSSNANSSSSADCSELQYASLRLPVKTAIANMSEKTHELLVYLYGFKSQQQTDVLQQLYQFSSKFSFLNLAFTSAMENYSSAFPPTLPQKEGGGVSLSHSSGSSQNEAIATISTRLMEVFAEMQKLFDEVLARPNLDLLTRSTLIKAKNSFIAGDLASTISTLQFPFMQSEKNSNSNSSSSSSFGNNNSLALALVSSSAKTTNNTTNTNTANPVPPQNTGNATNVNSNAKKQATPANPTTEANNTKKQTEKEKEKEKATPAKKDTKATAAKTIEPANLSGSEPTMTTAVVPMEVESATKADDKPEAPKATTTATASKAANAKKGKADAAEPAATITPQSQPMTTTATTTTPAVTTNSQSNNNTATEQMKTNESEQHEVVLTQNAETANKPATSAKGKQVKAPVNAAASDPAPTLAAVPLTTATKQTAATAKKEEEQMKTEITKAAVSSSAPVAEKAKETRKASEKTKAAAKEKESSSDSSSDSSDSESESDTESTDSGSSSTTSNASTKTSSSTDSKPIKNEKNKKSANILALETQPFLTASEPKTVMNLVLSTPNSHDAQSFMFSPMKAKKEEGILDKKINSPNPLPFLTQADAPTTSKATNKITTSSKAAPFPAVINTTPVKASQQTTTNNNNNNQKKSKDDKAEESDSDSEASSSSSDDSDSDSESDSDSDSDSEDSSSSSSSDEDHTANAEKKALLALTNLTSVKKPSNPNNNNNIMEASKTATPAALMNLLAGSPGVGGVPIKPAAVNKTFAAKSAPTATKTSTRDDDSSSSGDSGSDSDDSSGDSLNNEDDEKDDKAKANENSDAVGDLPKIKSPPLNRRLRSNSQTEEIPTKENGKENNKGKGKVLSVTMKPNSTNGNSTSAKNDTANNNSKKGGPALRDLVAATATALADDATQKEVDAEMVMFDMPQPTPKKGKGGAAGKKRNAATAGLPEGGNSQVNNNSQKGKGKHVTASGVKPTANIDNAAATTIADKITATKIAANKKAKITK